LLTTDMFARPESKQLLQFLQQHPDFDGSKKMLQALMSNTEVQNIGEYVKILALQHEELYQDLADSELGYEAARLTTRLVETYVRMQKQTLSAALANADDTQTATLLEQVKQLDALLNRVKGGI